MSDAAELQDEMISQGAHALIIKDELACTMQPLTKQGADGMRQLLKAYDAPAQFIEGVDRKQNGLYVAAIPLESRDTVMLANELARWIQGNVSIMEINEPLPQEVLKCDS